MNLENKIKVFLFAISVTPKSTFDLTARARFIRCLKNIKLYFFVYLFRSLKFTLLGSLFLAVYSPLCNGP